MKKVKFKRSGMAGKGMYIALCFGVLAVGAITAAGYKAAVGSLTKNLIPDVTIQSNPDPVIDSDEANAMVDNILKSPPFLTGGAGDVPHEAEESADITSELMNIYYEQAKMFPVPGEVLTEYSWGELVKAAGGVWRTHDGVDLSASEGDKVRAMTGGTVTEIKSDPLWGNCIVIDHGETVESHYFGLSPDIAVNVGDTVSPGQVIGTVGNTADIESDLDSHLHFALKFEGGWIDPVSYIEPMK